MRWLLLALFCLPSLASWAQGQQVQILYAGILEGFTTPDGQKARKLLRDAESQVRMKQDSTLMFCDSAYQYETTNQVVFFSRVKLIMPGANSTAVLTADRIDYDGNTRIAEVYNNITLADEQTTLRTNRMTYYRGLNFGFYQGGGTLTDPTSTLTSILGYYFSDLRRASFKLKVKQVSPDYTLTTDTLDYHTDTRTAYFQAPTWIQGLGKKKRNLYTESGWYQTRERKTLLYSHPAYRDSSYTLGADTLYYDDSIDRGWASCGVYMYNRDTTIALFGDRALIRRDINETRISQDPVLLQRFRGDTLALYADTLYAIDDSAHNNRRLRAYHNVRFSMREMQGVADSMEYERMDSILTLYQNPALWAGVNQITGDTIRFWMRNKQADSVRVYGTPFISSKVNDRDYNQITGRQLFGKLRNNQLVWLRVLGNAEFIYFSKNDDDQETGMVHSFSREFLMWLENNDPQRIKLIDKIEGAMHPLHEIYNEPNQLKGFRWRGDERPFRYLLPEPDRNPKPPKKKKKAAPATTAPAGAGRVNKP